MEEIALDCKGKDAAPEKFELLKQEVNEEMKVNPSIVFSSINKLSKESYDDKTYKELKDYLGNVKKYYGDIYDKATKSKDDWMAKFQENEAGKAEYKSLVTNFQNKKIEDAVKNENMDVDPVVIEEGKLVPTNDPIFRNGTKDRFVRSHFYAPAKSAFGSMYSTFWINIIVMWSMSLLLGITLYFDALRKFLRMFSSIQLKKKR